MSEETKTRKKRVEASTPTSIPNSEMVMAINEMVVEDKSEGQTEDVLVVVKDVRFTEEPQIMSKSSYEILKSQGIKIELC